MREAVRSFLLTGAGRACLVAFGVVLVVSAIRSIRRGRRIVGDAAVRIRDLDMLIQGRRAIQIGRLDVLQGAIWIAFGAALVVLPLLFPELLARLLRR